MSHVCLVLTRLLVNAGDARNMRASVRLSCALLAGYGLLFAAAETVRAQQPASAEVRQNVDEQQQEVVSYPASFFARYQPNTALDMVRQLPGFQLDEGGDLRGFGAAAGNILVNDRRPSAKQDLPSQILTRIPASHVARIELLRGQVRDIDLQGQSVMANIILRDDAPAAIRWELFGQENVDHGFAPGGNISVLDRWQEIDYNAGFSARKVIYGRKGPERDFDGSNQLIEMSTDDRYNENTELIANLNTTSWLGEVLLRLNLNPFYEKREEQLQTGNEPQVTGEFPSDEVFDMEQNTYRLELGMDAETGLTPDLSSNVIILAAWQDVGKDESERNFDENGDQTLFRLAETDTRKIEGIARLELDWSGWSNHRTRINLEGAYNLLDNELLQTEDSGSGLIEIEVPGGNARVVEYRGDFLLQDTWTLGSLEMTYGLGAETSKISQSGDAHQERSFFFLKPRLSLIYSLSQMQQTQFRLEREVAQLDFNDFVSATVFRDDDLALGNPDLEPDTTWIAELGHEWRFGRLGVVKLTVFHHFIDNTLDLLPLSPTFEATGNIGDARRWGLLGDSTLPLDPLGLAGARLDIKARWQDSRVTDPVTGQPRELSAGIGGDTPFVFDNENAYAYIVSYRQDFEAERWAWGWEWKERADRPLYKVNELDVFDEGHDLSAFAEATRWWGLKLRFEVQNILDLGMTRNRSIYAGERQLTPLDLVELRDRTRGRRFLLRVSGTL